jgi:hypothetical protein
MEGVRAMLDNELPRKDVKKSLKEGLPPRDRNADVPEHANTGTIWVGGVIAVCAVVALVMFGGSGNNSNTASNSPNTGPGMTTGAAPATPSKDGR